MGRRRKATGQTPRRKSTRKRERSLKGQFYDENFSDFSTETELGEGSILNTTPAIGRDLDLDTTRDIVERIHSGDNIPTEDIDTIEKSLHPDLSFETFYLENIDRLYKENPVLMNYVLFNIVDPVAGTEEDRLEASTVTITEGGFVLNHEEPEERQDTKKDNLFNREMAKFDIVEKDEVVLDNKKCEESGIGNELLGNNVPSLSVKLDQKNRECELLSKHLFEKSQRLKVLSDRVQQLGNESGY